MMRKVLCSFLLLFGLTMLSCGKGDTAPATQATKISLPANSPMACILDGRLFKTDTTPTYSYSSKVLTLSAPIKGQGDSIVSATLNIKVNYFTGVGSYPLSSADFSVLLNQVHYSFGAPGFVGTSGGLKVTAFDSTSKRIAGSFWAVLHAGGLFNTDHPAPGDITISDAVFNIGY